MTVKTASEPCAPDKPDAEHEPFRIKIQPAESSDSLVLEGDISLDAANRLREAVVDAAARDREIEIDWRRVGHMSAGALQLLLALRTALETRGRVLRVVGDNPGVRSTLELAGLSRFFPLPEVPG
jgi:anti-anti-sigma factor